MLVRIFLIIQVIPAVWNLLSPNGPDRLAQLQYLLGLQGLSVTSGSAWQAVSYAFIHGNWVHLLLNSSAILLLGAKLESFISKRSFWSLTIFSILCGAILFVISDLLSLHSHNVSAQTLVGSSSACFGLLLFLTTLSPESRFLPIFLSGRSLGAGIILANIILTLINPSLPTGQLALFGTYLSENYFPDLFKVSHSCHLGGSLFGFIYGKWLLRPRVTLKSLEAAREKRERRANIRS